MKAIEIIERPHIVKRPPMRAGDTVRVHASEGKLIIETSLKNATPGQTYKLSMRQNSTCISLPNPIHTNVQGNGNAHNSLDQQPEPLFGFPQRFLRPLALGDVANVALNDLLLIFCIDVTDKLHFPQLSLFGLER